ncbi:MAG: gamma-glutamyl-gamma-aminobutyrate hydrolase family protein [Nitrospirae bacterium]|nr:gamma-glutamyl-gamma-aminobutyrate hydrolase family protein [Nitrospirota bacterium]
MCRSDAEGNRTVSSPPLIAVTTGSRDNFPNEPHRYFEAVRKAGGIAEFVYSGTAKKSLMDHFDGFLIPGGKDIDPLRYNEKQKYEISREEQKRIVFELFLLREATKRRRPVLGICYGMQVINIFFKGSLYQDIQSQKEDSLDHRKGRHSLAVHLNPFLPNGSFEVNSSHHQAVKEIGKGLIPFAYADDAIVEGIYLEDYPFLLGIQWHPERMEHALSEAIFRAFVKESYELK